MRAFALARWRLPPLADILALAVAGAYTIVFVQGELGHRVPFGRLTIFAPLALLPVAVLRRAPLTRAQGAALAVVTILPLTFAWSLLISFSWLTAVAVPLMALAAVVASRYPAATMTGVFVCAGAFASLKLFAHVPAQKTVDVLLGGLWLGAMWRWVVSPRTTARLSIWPGVACIAIYVLFTAGEILTADNVTIGLQSFRASVWYLAVVPLIAYAPWSEASRQRLQRAVIALVLLIGAYATFRWAVGPTAAESRLARSNINNFVGSDLKPIGSFSTTKELAAWSAMAIPFSVGIALTMRGRWRAIAALGAVGCIAAMFATDVRAAPAAAVPGVVAVLVLYQLSQGFRGRRGATVAIVALSTLLVGGGAFVVTLGSSADSGQRYRAILDPASDPSYQARLVKWRTALDDIDTAPLGHGLGTAGNAQKRFGQFTNIGSVDVDNSYLKVAFEQGFVVTVFFMVAMVLLLVGLMRRALVALEPARAGPAIAACGTLVAMLVLFFIGNYVEGFPVLAGWVMVALGVSQFTYGAREPSEAATPPDELAAA